MGRRLGSSSFLSRLSSAAKLRTPIFNCRRLGRTLPIGAIRTWSGELCSHRKRVRACAVLHLQTFNSRRAVCCGWQMSVGIEGSKVARAAYEIMCLNQGSGTHPAELTSSGYGGKGNRTSRTGTSRMVAIRAIPSAACAFIISGMQLRSRWLLPICPRTGTQAQPDQCLRSPEKVLLALKNMGGETT